MWTIDDKSVTSGDNVVTIIDCSKSTIQNADMAVDVRIKSNCPICECSPCGNSSFENTTSSKNIYVEYVYGICVCMSVL